MGWFNHQLEDVRDLGLAKTLQPWYFFLLMKGTRETTLLTSQKPLWTSG